MIRNFFYSSWIECAFYFLFVIYGAILVLNANFGVIDDHELLGTLLSNKPLPYFVMPEIGRFFPLDASEYRLLSNFSTSPTIFYIYNLLQFLIVIVVIQKILVFKVGDNSRKFNFLALFFISLSPGFVTAWFRFFVPERNVLFFIALFLYCFLRFHKDQKLIFAVVGIFFANVALYYKEPVFILLGSFVFFHLLFSWKELNLNQKIFDLLLLLSSIIFLLTYFTLVYLRIGEHIYGLSTINPILVMAKNIFNACLGDPLIIFLLIPLFFWRIYVTVSSKEKVNPLFDSLLISSVIYVLVFIKLNMYAYHYLLPVYVFAIPVILYFFFDEMLYKRKAFRLFGSLALLVTIFSSLPTAVHLMSHYKNVPNNFQNTLSFLDKYIKKESSDGSKVVIFIDGVNRGASREIYISFIRYLEFRGLNSTQFDFKTAEDDDGISGVAFIDSKSQYAVWKKSTASSIQSGDLVVMTPYSKKYIGLKKNEIKDLLDEYKIIYHAASFIEIPNLGLKPILKLLFKQSDFRTLNNKTMVSENVIEWPLDFYVLQKN